MERKEYTHTSQFDFSFHTHGTGCMSKAVKDILDGKIVSFDCFKRGDTDCKQMIYQGTHYIGLAELEGHSCLRTSTTPKIINEEGSNSLIASWYPKEIVTDPVIIAATIVSYFKSYTDYFIN